MPCIPIKDGIICLSRIDFECPYCGKGYDDIDDIYLGRCNRNKSGITTKTCNCGKRFGICYDYTGNMVSFEFENFVRFYTL